MLWRTLRQSQFLNRLQHLCTGKRLPKTQELACMIAAAEAVGPAELRQSYVIIARAGRHHISIH